MPRVVAASFAAVMVVSCAHVEAPSGGPEDKTPPRVAAVYPAPGELNVPLDASFVFQFSEWIDRSAARNMVLVSPPLRGGVTAQVRGDRLVARPGSGTLRANTPYQVTVLGTVRDLRGNTMGEAFRLRFSTGDFFDSAAVAGRALQTTRRGSMVAALYRMDDRASALPLSARDTAFRSGETPEPWRELPAFLAVADTGGFFAFDSVSQGDYALFVFEDLNGNFSFDLGVEAAATGTLSLSMRPHGPDQFLRLAPLDTLPLRVPRVEFLPDTLTGDSADPRVTGLIALHFARAPHPLKAVEVARYRILPADGDTSAVLSAAGAAWSPLHEAWVLEPPPLRPGALYRVEFRRPDFPGRHGDDGLDTSASFAATAPGDAAAWSLSVSLPAGITGHERAASAPLPGSSHTFVSNLPLTPSRMEAVSQAARAYVNDTVPVAFTARRTGPVALALDLTSPLAAGASLTLRLPHADEDSMPVQLFTGRAADSANTGRLRFAPPEALRGYTFWVRSATTPVEHRLETAGDSVRSGPLPVGNYRLFAFEDRDGDGVWHPGSLRPWIPQETQVAALDSVAVIPREMSDLTVRLAEAWAPTESPSGE